MVSRSVDAFLLIGPLQASYQAGEVDSVLQLIFLSKVNILQVFCKLDV